MEGILKNKFPSSRLEMNAVADKFDHGDGMIDWREFMAALRPDWEDRCGYDNNVALYGKLRCVGFFFLFFFFQGVL